MGSRPCCYLFSALSVLCRGVVLRTKDTRDSVLDAWTRCWQRRVMAVRGNWEEWVGMNFEIRKGVWGVCGRGREERERNRALLLAYEWMNTEVVCVVALCE